MNKDSVSNETTKYNSMLKSSLNNKNENNKEKIEINKEKQKQNYQFNNLQISTNNNVDSIKENSLTYISEDKKSIQKYQISNINSNNNKYSNNDSHQGISFISKSNINKSDNFKENTKINQQQVFSYIAPENNKNQKKELLIESQNKLKSEHEGISYIVSENSKNNQIISNSNQSKFNLTTQEMSFICKDNLQSKDKENNLKIFKNKKQNEISYIAPENIKNNIFEIGSNPINNIISSNKSNITQKSHHEIKYIVPEKSNSSEYKISSDINKINYTQPNDYKPTYNIQLSTQNNTYTYLANKEKEINNDNISNKKNFEISSNNNLFYYISKGVIEKKENLKFNHNESMTFICEEKKNNVFIQCNADKFRYIKDEATGAQVMENELN